MTQVGAPRHDPIPIGDRAPPFVCLPDPRLIFQQRGERFRALADGHDLKPCLLFPADIGAVQRDIQDGLPPVELPGPDALARAGEHAMPPLDHASLDPVADEVASRGLDLMVRERGMRRAGVNRFLLGYRGARG